ncbi:MAG: DUF4258 domain-containing protein [Xanthomonadaceae bacterium]|nr:DUF4258 domain-containing protein [Xanthomonadaceae bacterium]MDP2186575.1 DUF4258 domain-containing protein [Xanthomonadales bacterium]MDZ4115623.1 DUF4258 domain-containing protein [Xanthomonadaceae bacterium]MDZ4378929.1 DUF4258 domain-containing protein [Xanthomonadaceae bacterium]
MVIDIRVWQKIAGKLAEKHHVTIREIEECFANRCGAELTDSREQHASDPPTRWFIAATNHCRLLKIVYVLRDSNVHIRTAYEPNEVELAIYRRHGGNTE